MDISSGPMEARTLDLVGNIRVSENIGFSKASEVLQKAGSFGQRHQFSVAQTRNISITWEHGKGNSPDPLGTYCGSGAQQSVLNQPSG